MSWQTALRKTTARLTQGFSRPMFRTKDVDWDRLVSLDFETYYDDDYTLKKLSTSEYVRDKRFKAQMVGIKIGLNKPTRIYGPKQIAAALKKINWATHALLCHHTQFDGLILSHHYGIVPSYYYDTLSMARGLHSNEIGAGLEEVSLYYGGQGKLKDVLDTTKGVLDWPPALFKSVSLYCANDTDEMLRVFREMHLSMPASEMDLISQIVRMFCDPVLKLDVPRVEAELAREIAERKALMINVLNPREREADIKLTGKEKLANPVGEARDLLIVKKVVGSNERFADLLRAEGIEPPVKISKSWMAKPRDQRKDEDKWTYAFAKDDLEFTSLPDDVEKLGADLDLNKPADIKVLAARQTRLRALVDVRLSVKSTTNITRAQRFLSSADGGLALPVYYAYSRAHTHRLGGGDKRNYQNLQRGGELRQSIEAPPGHVLGVSDSGQIEARVNAMLWGQNDLITQFRNKEDPYCSLATILYGRTITPADKTERFVGKVCRLGLGFGMGAPKLQMTLAKGALGGPPLFVPLEMCTAWVRAYRNSSAYIVKGWAICNQIIEDMAVGRTGNHGPISWEANKIWGPNGLFLHYPDLKKSVDDNGWDQWTYRSGDIRKKLYGGLLCENIVQFLARIIVMGQLLEISKTARVVMTTHDEVVTCVKKAQAELNQRRMLKIMATSPDWWPDIPLAAEGGYAVNYSK